MKIQLFAVYDLKAFAFIPPFTMNTVEMAQRAFSEGANETSHMFSKHPTDFTLFHLGEFDDATGEINAFPQNINLGLAATYQRNME